MTYGPNTGSDSKLPTDELRNAVAGSTGNIYISQATVNQYIRCVSAAPEGYKKSSIQGHFPLGKLENMKLAFKGHATPFSIVHCICTDCFGNCNSAPC